jgi:hypothetical protein
LTPDALKVHWPAEMPTSHDRRHTPSLLVALIPVVAMIGGLPFVNRVEPLVLGLPFLLAWILGWVVVTPVFLGVAYFASTEACATGKTDGDGTTPGGGAR